jgi:hypothetical protein
MPATRLAAFSCLLCLACSADGGHTLQVNLRSDLRSGIEVVVARAELFDEAPAPGQTAPATSRDRALDEAVPLGDGIRLTDYGLPDPGRRFLRVQLLGASGEAVLERRAVVQVRGVTVATMVMTRDCVGVECPTDDPALLACVGGRCVDPRCTPETPEFCPPPVCDDDTACEVMGCADGRCVDDVCMWAERPGACEPTQWCSPEAGCVDRPAEDAGLPPSDAGDPLSDAGPAGGDAGITDASSACPPAFDSFVATDEDDVEVDHALGLLTDSPQGLYMGYWGVLLGTAGPTSVGLRFTLGAAIPEGATVTDAFLRFWGIDASRWGEADQLFLGVVDAADSPPILATSDRDAPTVEPPVSFSGDAPLAFRIGDWNESVDLSPALNALVAAHGGLAEGAHVTVWMSAGDAERRNREVATNDFGSDGYRPHRLRIRYCLE